MVIEVRAILVHFPHRIFLRPPLHQHAVGCDDRSRPVTPPRAMHDHREIRLLAQNGNRLVILLVRPHPVARHRQPHHPHAVPVADFLLATNNVGPRIGLTGVDHRLDAQCPDQFLHLVGLQLAAAVNLARLDFAEIVEYHVLPQVLRANYNQRCSNNIQNQSLPARSCRLLWFVHVHVLRMREYTPLPAPVKDTKGTAPVRCTPPMPQRWG